MAKAAAAKKTDTEVLETHEAIVIDPIPDMEPTKEEGKKDPSTRMEESMTRTLAKYNVTNAFLAELNSQYKDLTITGQDDKEGYTAVHEARMIFVKTRTKIKDICEAGRESAVFIQKKWIAKQRELTEVIQPGETRLKKLEDDFDAEKDRLKAEKIEMQRTRLRGRMQELLAMGAISDGVDVYLDDVTFSQTDIREADDEDYQSDIVPAFKKLFDAKEKIRLDAEAETARLKKIQDDERALFEQQQQQFKQQQLEFENQKKAAALEKRNGRISQLENIGMSPDYRNGDYVYKDYRVSNESLDTVSDEAWRVVFREAESTVKTIKDNEETQNRLAEEKRLEDARIKVAAELKVKERSAEIKGLGYITNQYAVSHYKESTDWSQTSDKCVNTAFIYESTDEEWATRIISLKAHIESEDKRVAQELKEKTIREENERKEKLQQQQLEESEQATDKVKWGTFIEQLNQVKLPTMKRQPYKTYVENAALFIKKINAI